MPDLIGFSTRALAQVLGEKEVVAKVSKRGDVSLARSAAYFTCQVYLVSAVASYTFVVRVLQLVSVSPTNTTTGKSENVSLRIADKFNNY